MSSVNKARSDIFADNPLPKAFYHPSRQKQVDHLKKEACLASDRLSQDQLLDLDPEDVEFLKGGYSYSMPDTRKNKYLAVGEDNSGRFDESWPESERPSSVSIPDLSEMLDYSRVQPTSVGAATYAFQVPERDTDSGKKAGAKTMDSSTLSKYIERFRFGQPTSREDREKGGAVRESDFWWLNKTPASDSSTLITEGDSNVRSKKQPAEMASGRKNGKKSYVSLKDYSASGKDFRLDEDLKLLHNKADRLLEKTGSSLHSSEPVVSTEGLGSDLSTTSDTPRSVQELAYRPAFTEPYKFCKPVNPEDDILVQWRRNRKVELMKTSDALPLHQTGSRDLENKLAAFRKKLAFTISETKAIGAPASSKHPLAKSELSVTERLKRSLSKQVDSESQTSPNITPRQSHSKDPPPVETSHNAPHAHSPIASPNLPRRFQTSPPGGASGGARELEPHLHLSCDIIPCPVVHSQRYHSEGQSREQLYKEDLHHGRRSKRQQSRDSIPDGDQANLNDRGGSEESDSSFELMKMKHLRLLKQEQELLKQVSRTSKGQGQTRKGEGYSGVESGRKERDYDESASRENRKKTSHMGENRERETDGRSGSRSNGGERFGMKESRGKETDYEKITSRGTRNNVNEKHKETFKRESDTRKGSSKVEGQRGKENTEYEDIASRHKGRLDKKSDKETNMQIHRASEDFCDIISSDESFTDVTDLNPSRISSSYSRQRTGTDRGTTEEGQGQGETLKVVESSRNSKRRDVKMPSKNADATNMQQSQKGPRSSQGSRSAESMKKRVLVPAPQASVSDSQEGVIDKLPRPSQSRRAGLRPLHSSPMPSLNSAIEQVVGDHLFMSSVSFASSVDSVRASRQTIHEQPEVALSQDENFEAAIQSDGEEFKEDEILRDLRKRRQVYLHRLACVEDARSKNKTVTTKTSAAGDGL